GRAPEPGVLATDVANLQSGTTFEQLEAVLAGSLEYFLRHGGTNQTFLAALYTDLLHRPADAAGEEAWLQVMATGVSRTEVAGFFIGGTEYSIFQVESFYLRFLRHLPDTTFALPYWTSVEQSSGQDIVIANIVGSLEYFLLAQANKATPIPTLQSVSP